MKTPAPCNLEEESVIVSVGPDGRVYFHDLDADLIRVALALNPADPAMLRRLELCERHAAASPVDEHNGQ